LRAIEEVEVPIKALIVDDEAAARSELRYALQQIPSVTVVGEAATAAEALELIRNVQYDIVFLDIKMPGLTGIELAAAVRALASPPAFIFVTAYSDYAVQAFELEAFDYILKPIDPARVAKSISRLTKARHRNLAKQTTKPAMSKIFVSDGDKKVPIDVDDIFFFSSEDDYARLHTSNASYLLASTLKELEERLRAKNFFRVHRRFLVNLNKVGAVVTLSRNVMIVRLNNPARTEIPVSRRRTKALKEALGL
jgi:DNA-binding LytR/AlgR family response regulator